MEKIKTILETLENLKSTKENLSWENNLKYYQ